MKIGKRGILIALSMAILGGIVGYFAGAKVTTVQADVSIQALALSESATRIAQQTMLLKILRQDGQDCAIDRLETMLDHTLIHLADEYSSGRDWYGGAAKSLTFARDYRATYPRKPASDLRAKRVEAALALNTDDNPR